MKRLLFTGASGFLGRNIMPLLQERFDEVITLGHLPQDDITVNLAADIPVLPGGFDTVLHAAGKAHVVPKTPEEEKMFFDVNLEGTKNLCAALDRSGLPASLIFISTVAVYGCEFGELITEDHPLEGDTPYALSKLQAERFLQEWCADRGVVLTILRPSLLAGTNPPGNLGDMIAGIQKGFYLNIGGGKVRKSVLMAQDIANIIPMVAMKGGVYNVCDTEQPSFGDLSRLISSQLGKKEPFSIPYWIAKCMALVGDLLGKKAPINSDRLRKLTESLTFSNDKARKELGWEPLKVMDNFHIF